ncbi:hypothetical protein ACNKXS_13740, partial [Christiangramia marina]|uniref:hypothetical protein n=1 Tax=Christiangramia marina TaxID=409436 RepID=UPI003AA7D2F3
MKKSYRIETELKQLITPAQAFQYRIIPVSKVEEKFKFLTDIEDRESLTIELNIILGGQVELLKDSKENIQSY